MLGILTYVPDPGWEQCEILTLHVTGQWHGVGTALIEAVEQLAAGHGCARLWLATRLNSKNGRERQRLAAVSTGMWSRSPVWHRERGEH
jgi:GNAT superfamily N-acetyltransferase